MADPVLEFYEDDGFTIIDAGNPLSFGLVSKGGIALPSKEAQSPIQIWNDKGGGAGSVEMQDVKIGVKDSLGGNTGEFILGTALNGNTPFMEVRSDGATGTTDDAQGVFEAVGGDTYRDIGNIPANAGRDIYLRMNIPADATVGAFDGLVVIDYTFEA